MELLHPRCAGLDVHKESVVACVRLHLEGRVSHEVRTFSTTTSGLLELNEWLVASGCTHVVLESTGVYWKPVWHILSEAEASFELVLANAEHVRNVPGRKTDVKDAVWLADLLAHGLVHSSFVPPTPIQELRDLMRTRRQLLRQKVQHVQRIQKVLEDANIKLESVISDILGLSGRKILEAIASGTSDPQQLVALATTRLKASRQTLLEALRGRPTVHHRFLLELHLGQITATEATVAKIDTEVERLLEPFRVQLQLLTTIPGVSYQTAATIISEIGVDMTQFPSSAQLISWAGFCPELRESAGKKKRTRIRKGATWLKPVLVQAAWAGARRKNTYLRAQYGRLKTRRGAKKAVVAVAASILTAAYHMLQDGTTYQDLGSSHFERIDRGRATRRLVGRLQALGYDVQLREAA